MSEILTDSHLTMRAVWVIIILTNKRRGGSVIKQSQITETPNPGDRHYSEYQNLLSQTDNQLQRSARSYAKEISEHRNKITNPAANAKDWKTRSEAAQAGLINFWNKEIEALEVKLAWANGLLAERGL